MCFAESMVMITRRIWTGLGLMLFNVNIAWTCVILLNHNRYENVAGVLQIFLVPCLISTVFGIMIGVMIVEQCMTNRMLRDVLHEVNSETAPLYPPPKDVKYGSMTEGGQV